MTLAIALSALNARTLREPDLCPVGPLLDNLHTNRAAPAKEARSDASGKTVIMFGSFCLLPMQRLLLEADQPVRLGGRALDILIALIERHGELVTKKELIGRVWPGATVVEANITVHISALRRLLRDGQAGHRYLVNVPAQGYRFVAPITIAEKLPPTSTCLPAMEPDFDTRAMLTRLIGRADEVRRLAAELLQASDTGAERLDEPALIRLR